MIIDSSVPAVFDGKAFVPDHPVDLQTGKKYLLIIEEAPPEDPHIITADHKKEGYETAFLSEDSLAREWLTPEEDEAWEYL
jgi:hypothetical protein